MNRKTGSLHAPPGYLTPAEAASRYGLSKATIYRWIKVGIVASRKVGMAAVFASVADLDRMMARESVEAK